MKELWLENIKIKLQHLVPVISSILLILIFNIPLYPFVGDSIRPYVSIICIYFWLTYRPDLMGITSIYIIGMLEDFVTSTPLGSNIFAMLLLYILTNIVFKFVNNKPFIIIWYGFCFTSAVTLFSKWFIISIYYSKFLPILPLIFGFLATIAFYPLLSVINAYIHEYFIKEED